MKEINKLKAVEYIKDPPDYFGSPYIDWERDIYDGDTLPIKKAIELAYLEGMLENRHLLGIEKCKQIEDRIDKIIK